MTPDPPAAPRQQVQLIQATSPEHFAQARRLFEEYGASLSFDLCFQNFAEELAGLPGEYAPPEGRLLLAFWEGQPVGCVALRKLEDRICEMKRLYLQPQFRGRHWGRHLAEAVMNVARRAGYDRMRLDTVESMIVATALYRSLGFRPIPPYRFNPLPGVQYLEADLAQRTL
jgi:putative acetyltransferase